MSLVGQFNLCYNPVHCGGGSTDTLKVTKVRWEAPLALFLWSEAEQLMISTILGKKGQMGAVYTDGVRVPVTAVSGTDCSVSAIRTKDKDGYWAVQVVSGGKKRELRVDSEPDVKAGDKISLTEILKEGDKVQVTGISKGKGFAGVVKRWHFAGGPKTHGQSDRQRAPGSIGQGTTPGRVYKGKHMAGRMGSEKKTIKNLKVISVNPEKNEVFISGSLPGRTGSLIFIKKI